MTRDEMSQTLARIIEGHQAAAVSGDVKAADVVLRALELHAHLEGFRW